MRLAAGDGALLEAAWSGGLPLFPSARREGEASRMTTETNVATLRRAIQAINDRDLTVNPTLVTPGFIRHDLAGAFREIGGREGVTDFLQLLLEAVPDLQIREEELIATGDRAALRVTLTGTHRGAFQGVAPTGNRVEISGTHTYRFQDGLFAETWQLWDVATFLRQIGVVSRGPSA